MSDSIENLRHKISIASDLQSVVRTMKSISASSIGLYEQTLLSLEDYSRTIELGLGLCFRKDNKKPNLVETQIKKSKRIIGAIVFGSDQGLVGKFNEEIAEYANRTLKEITQTPHIWAVGERVSIRLEDLNLSIIKNFAVPNSVEGITTLVGDILIEIENKIHFESTELYLFYNKRNSGSFYEPMSNKMLPLDKDWQIKLTEIPWPTKKLPEVIGTEVQTLRSLIREYLFVSLFQTCSESLASENSSRLAAMERADKNINELLINLNASHHRLRQSGIDEELFDVISGYEALLKTKP